MQVEDLLLHFRTSAGIVQAVDRVNLDLERGKAMVILGESGCGKTSLARAILRLLPRNVHEYTGKVYIGDLETMALSDEEYRQKVRWLRVSMVPQAAMNSLNPVMRVGDQVADEDELRSGVRREGAFFGVNALLTKPAQSIALALMPFVLESADFITREANQGQIMLDQPASALWGIKILVGLIPGVAMILGAIILQWYPLRGDYLQKVQQQVLDLHARKHAQQLARTSASGSGS